MPAAMSVRDCGSYCVAAPCWSQSRCCQVAVPACVWCAGVCVFAWAMTALRRKRAARFAAKVSVPFKRRRSLPSAEWRAQPPSPGLVTGEWPRAVQTSERVAPPWDDCGKERVARSVARRFWRTDEFVRGVGPAGAGVRKCRLGLGWTCRSVATAWRAALAPTSGRARAEYGKASTVRPCFAGLLCPQAWEETSSMPAVRGALVGGGL